MRTSMWSPSSSAGGRVWGVISSSPRRGPIVRASRTMIHPVGVFQVVSRVLVPGSYTTAAGWLMPNGPSRKRPGPAVEQGAEHARRVEARDAQPVDRSVRSDERTRVAVGQERVVRDRREGRRRGGALRLRRGGLGGAHGSPRAVPAAVVGDELVRGVRPPRSLLVVVHLRRVVEQRLEDPPGLLDAVLPGEARAVPVHRRVQQHLVGRRQLLALLPELHVEVDLLAARPGRSTAPATAAGRRSSGRASRRADPGSGRRFEVEAQPRRPAEDEPQLGLQ